MDLGGWIQPQDLFVALHNSLHDIHIVRLVSGHLDLRLHLR